MRITTWNVLHRIHAVNWQEAPVSAFPDERVRIAGIASMVAQWLTDGVDVVCLQEVSGDQLAALRRDDVTIFDHRYPRIPRLRQPGPTELEDPGEHLVVLVRGGLPARLREGLTFESDPGKGLLTVEIGADLLVACTHVTFGDRRTAQLARLAAAAAAQGGAAVVCGDFNAPFDVVQLALGEELAIGKVASPTRIPTKDAPAKTIDHIAVRRATIAKVEVLDARGLSDHLPVAAEIVMAEA